MLSKVLKAAAIISASLILLSGCAINMPVPIKDPVASNLPYGKTTAAPVNLTFLNEQSDADKAQFMTGLIPMNLLYKDKPFESVTWVTQHTVKEMAARGLPVTLGNDAASGTKVSIKRLHIENHRVSGFSPFVTFTTLKADVMVAGAPQRVTAYVKRGKVPVWSFDEVIDPTYNDPLATLTKEFAAKLNQKLFGQVVADDQVNALIAKVSKNTAPDAYLDVYQLGFSNNSIAIPELVKLTAHSDEYVRLAAISSLGILKAVNQTDMLIALYELKDGLWQDRAMALKAVGDMDTPKSRAYLKGEFAKYEGRTDKEAVWTKEIIQLYL